MTTQVDSKKKTKVVKKTNQTIANIINTERLADICNLSERRVQQLTGLENETKENKFIFEPLSNKPYTFDLEKSVRAYIRYLQDMVVGKQNKLENLKKEGSKLDADVELKQVKIQTERLKLAELEGSMHRSEDVKYMTDDLVLSIRSMLLAIPSRLADDLTDISDSKEVHHIIKNEVVSILHRLSLYQYDPKAYKERVNERNKKDVDYDEDDE